METIDIKQIMDLDFQVSEAYKTLRSNIIFSGSDIKIIGLTSCIPNEGKSSVSLNLAVSMAETGKTVILVDADMRNSILTGIIKINKPVKGLSHYLVGLNTIEEIIYQSDISSLDIIYPGPVPPNPSELIGKEEFSKLLKELSQIYDYVAAKACDGMILVVETNAISYKLARKVTSQLEKTGCKILGAVLNKVKTNSHSYYGKQYGDYYSKYNTKDISKGIFEKMEYTIKKKIK